MPAFNFGEMKFPDFKIGEHAPAAAAPSMAKAEQPAGQSPEPKGRFAQLLKFHPSTHFKIVGHDKKIYGPVSGQELLQWLADGRVNAASLAQKVGSKEWKQLAAFALAHIEPSIPVPPPLLSALHWRKDE